MGAFIGFIIFVAIIYYIFKLFEHNEREKTDDRNNDIETTSISSKENITKNTSTSSKNNSGEAVNANVNSNIDSNVGSKKLFDAYMQILRGAYSELAKQNVGKKTMTLSENSLSFCKECPNGETGFFLFVVDPKDGIHENFSNSIKEEYALSAFVFVGINKSSVPYYSGLASYCNFKHRQFHHDIVHEDHDYPGFMIQCVVGDPSTIEDINNSKDAYQFIYDLTEILDTEMIFVEEAKKDMAEEA